MNLKEEITSGFSAKTTRLALNFVGSLFIANLLGPATFGGVYLLLAILGLLGQALSGWATACRIRLSSEAISLANLLGAYGLFFLAWLMLITVGAYVSRGMLTNLTGLSWAWLFLVLLALVNADSGLYIILEGQGRIGTASWVETLKSFVVTPTQILLVSLAALGAAGMIYGFVFGGVLMIPVFVYLFGQWPSWPTQDTFVSLFELAPGTTATMLFSRAYDRIDLLLLSIFATTAAVGNYELAWKLTMPSLLLVQVASSGLMTRVSSQASDGEIPTRSIEKVLSYSSLLAFPLVGGAVVVGDLLFNELFPAYENAAMFLVGLGVYQVIRTQTEPLLQSIMGLEDVTSTMKLSGAAVVVNIVVGVPLLFFIGPLGVILATIFAELVRYAGCVRTLSRRAQFSLFSRPILAQLVASVCMAVVVFVTRKSLAYESIVSLAGFVVLGTTCYLIALLAFSPTTRDLATAILFDRISTR